MYMTYYTTYTWIRHDSVKAEYDTCFFPRHKQGVSAGFTNSSTCHTIPRNTTTSPFRLSQLCYCTCRCSGMWRRVSELPKDRSVPIFNLKQSQSILVGLVNCWRWRSDCPLNGREIHGVMYGRPKILYNNLICVSILRKLCILVGNQLSKLATSYHKVTNWLSI